MGKYWSVYETLKSSTSSRGRFLFAKACYHIDECNEAEIVLTEELNKGKGKKSGEETINVSHLFNLLG